MPDREKVIKGLEHCAFGVSDTCYENDCPYYQSHDCTDELKNDIFILLKEQEPVEPKKDLELNELNIPFNVYYCGACGARLYGEYCSKCGRAAKRE